MGSRPARPGLPRSLMEIEPAVSIRGALAVPGDKSISHRALLVGAVCDGAVVVSGLGRSLDTESTLAAIRALGVEVVEEDADTLRVRGVGLKGLGEPERADRLRQRGDARETAAGVARRTGGSPLRADGRRIAPIAADGSDCGSPREHGCACDDERRSTADDDRRGGAHGYRARAGCGERAGEVVRAARGALRARGTTVVERVPTRDHTERLLRAAGARVETSRDRVFGEPGRTPRP